MDYSIEHLDCGAVFTITRPDRLNALNQGVWDGLETCLGELEGAGARMLLVTGQGDRAFSAGSDLKDAPLDRWEQQVARNDRIRNLLLRLSRSELFTVAAINGIAYGGGLELALACTVRTATSNARFAMPEIRLGVMPTYGGTQLLPAMVGRALATDLMLTGRSFDAQQALQWGLVSFVNKDRASMLEAALALGAEVAGFSRIAWRGILQCLANTGGMPDQAAMDVEGLAMRQVLASTDAREGIAAFIEKRKPVFSER